MHIRQGTFHLEMNKDEVQDIFYALHRAIQASVSDHFTSNLIARNYDALALFHEQTGTLLTIMKQMAGLLLLDAQYTHFLKTWENEIATASKKAREL